MIPIYQQLVEAIRLWKEAFSHSYALYEESASERELCIVRDYGFWKEFHYTGIKRLLYAYFYIPHTLEQASADFGIVPEQLRTILSDFLEDQTMIFLDNRYLSLATKSSQYRWKKFNVMPNSG